MLSFKDYLEEGINDPAIFKAVFTAGGPGSGKSFTAKKMGLVHMGFRPINSDLAFEKALEKAGLDSGNPDDIFSFKGQQVRKSAKQLTAKQMRMAIDGRLGLLIDGTGKDYQKIKYMVTKLRQLGYEVAMIMVATDLETAIERDKERGKEDGGRSLGAKSVTNMWKEVMANQGKFQALFGNEHFHVINNNIGDDINKATQNAFKKIGAWAKKEPRMPQAKAWMVPRKKS